MAIPTGVRSFGPVLVRAPHGLSILLAQRPVEVGQAFEQELRPWAGCVTAVEQAVIEAEDGHDVVVGIQRRPQRRVLVQAQVAPEPDDRTHVPAGSGWSRSATARSR